MLVACCILYLLCVTGQCENKIVLPLHHDDHKTTACVIGILNKYFTERKELTYVNMNSDDDAVLKAIHSTLNISLISRQPTYQMFVHNQAYLTSFASVAEFTQYFGYLIREPLWNPYARFLIVIRSIQDNKLRLVFDELLRLHVNNALVMNATDDINLYTYNPFENYACGRYYSSVVSFGICSQTTNDLYPNKLVTGLKDCNFRASIAHRPPFGIDPLRADDKKTLLGTEEYIIRILSKKEQFTVSFDYKYNVNQFSSAAPNMTAIGPMTMLQKNECDVIFGGMMMIASRAEAFTHLCGYHDYSDELRFAVKSASLIPTWKYIYLLFEFKVWEFLLITFAIFLGIAIVVLRAKDAGYIVLRLLDNLLLHSRDFRARQTVKYLLITWVWFAYLINSFYQSNLYSFTTHPSKDYQISNEIDLKKFPFRPCFSNALQEYLKTSTGEEVPWTNLRKEGCQTSPEALVTISTTSNLFTMVPNYFYLYNERKFNDKWGDPLIYYFDKPYTKFLFGYFFYKGFPITPSLRLNALRMRESGLADKSLHDHYFARRLKQKFSQKTFQTRFAFPWCICIPGVLVATITFIIEIITKHTDWFRCKTSLT